MPLGVAGVAVNLTGTGWPAATSISVIVEISQDGGTTWANEGEITANNASLASGACSVGVLFASPNANANLAVRGRVSVQSTTPITLVGTLTSN